MADRRFWLLTLGALAAVTLLLGWGVNRYLVEQRVTVVESQLQLVNNLRRAALSRYLETAEAELTYWSTNLELLGYMRFLSVAWPEARARGVDPERRLREVYIDNNPFPPGERSDFVDAPQANAYRTVHAQLHPLTRKFVSERGYYDFFLIDGEGNVSYTVEKEDDFGTNLLTGPYRDTGLAKAFRRALEQPDGGGVAYSDFERYAPSKDAPAMFMARAMRDSDGTLLGVLAFQLPTDRIVHMMDLATEGTETGEAYIVGQDLMMRSESRFVGESSVLRVQVDTAPAHRALNSEYGVMLADDYRGKPVYSAYSSLVVGDFLWGLLVEMDRAEVLERASGHRDWLAGLLLLLYGLGAWSAWYLRGADVDAEPVFPDLEGGVDPGD